MKIIAVSPTYNESQNIESLIVKLISLPIKLDILVVDDSSPDGTGDIVKNLMNTHSNLYIIERKAKDGLGTAYKAGFDWCLTNNYDYIIQIDADLSHDPKEITAMIRRLNKFDFIIGSRYINGVNVINWPLGRLILSSMANKYVRIITGLPVKDATSGYNCFNAKILNKINYKKITSQGYSFQVEFKYLVWINKFSINEHPIIFNDRTVGQSKMSRTIIFEAIYKVLILKIRRIFRLL